MAIYRKRCLTNLALSTTIRTCFRRRWMSSSTNSPAVAAGAVPLSSSGGFVTPVPFDKESVTTTTATAAGKDALTKYRELISTVLQGGGPKGIERHVVKNRKVLIRDRIRMLLDEDSDFVEIGKLAGFDMPYGDIVSAGVIAGIGRVRGIYCMVSGNDATVKAGSYYPITVKKSGRAQWIAEMNRLPVIYMPDSAGAFLPLQSEIFIHGGRGFYNQAVMSSQGIPQIALVCGSCTAGGAYNPTMSDEAIIVDRIGKIFLGGPPLVKAATGEIVSDEDLGGGFMHSSVSGCTDYFARSETEAIEMCREIVESLNMTNVPPRDHQNFESPKFGIDWNELEGRTHYDKVSLYGILAQLLDGSTFKEFKSFYGPGLIAGTGHIEGNMVGIVANCDEILEAESLKAAHFLDMCNRRNIPAIFLQNSQLNSPQSTGDCSLYLKHRGIMSSAVATLTVPKISVTLSACGGDDYLLMCGPSFNPNLNFSWPWATFSPLTMGDEERNNDADDTDAFYMAFNMLVDVVVTPQDTRKTLGETLRILKQQVLNPMKEGISRPVFRM